MITVLRDRFHQFNRTVSLVAAAVLGLAFFLGRHASPLWLALLTAGICSAVLLAWPVLGLPMLILAALIVPLEFNTGTEVSLNTASLLVPALLALWLLDMVRRRQVRVVASPVNKPLFLFLASGLLSLLVGRATWDPVVPLKGNFLLVQLVQWAIFGFSAGTFWLTGNLVPNSTWLRRLTFLFLTVAGIAAVPLAVQPYASAAVYRSALLPPFWMLLAAMASGQLLFNNRLSRRWRSFLLITLGSVFICVFYHYREYASAWIGVVAVAGMLAWLRWPRLRWPAAILLLVLTGIGFLSSTVYELAGGDAEWEESGGSRLVLIGRVIEVTMRNPITGLGPAAYRPYANMRPLFYRGAYWVAPQINSHNNYVDLFSHVGLLGLGTFLWFCFEVARLGLRLSARYSDGFASGYVNGILAAGVAALVMMALADWILPFVYNIGFQGFQSSVLIWLFLGGLVALEKLPEHSEQ